MRADREVARHLPEHRKPAPLNATIAIQETTMRILLSALVLAAMIPAAQADDPNGHRHHSRDAEHQAIRSARHSSDGSSSSASSASTSASTTATGCITADDGTVTCASAGTTPTGG